MKIQTTQKIAAVLVPTALFLGMISPALAEDSRTVTGEGNVKSSVISAGKKDAAVTRSSAEIKKREDDLSELLQRISEMKNVSAETKATITASVQKTITDLNTLKSKIESDTDKTELQKDLKSIANSTRVYMLVAPQARIAAAADRIGTVADMITAMNAKLQVRIDAAKTAGKDVTAIAPLQADITAKIADAKTQAAAAIAAIAGLTPDNGDTAKLQANQAALKVARTAISAGEKDLNAAQKDIKKITQVLKSVHPNRVGEGEKRNEVEKKSEDNSSTTTNQ